MLCGRRLPEEDNARVVSISIAAGLCGSRGGSDHGASTRRDGGKSGATARDGRSEPPNGGTMAAMVGGRVFTELLLEMGSRTVSHSGGLASLAAVVAGIVSGVTTRGTNRGPAAFHASSDDDIGDARNLRVGRGPQRMRVDSAGCV